MIHPHRRLPRRRAGPLQRLTHRGTALVGQRAVPPHQRPAQSAPAAGEVIDTQAAAPDAFGLSGGPESIVRRRVAQFGQQVQAGVQASEVQFFRCKGFPQGFCQGVPPGLIGHPLPGQMAGEVTAGDEPRQCLLLKTAHRAGVEGVFRMPCGQKLLRQHHVGDADAGREAAGAGGEVDHRPVGPRHPLQAGQGPGVETELRIVVVLDDVPLSGTPCRPVEQFCPASGGHGDARGKLVAGGDVAHRCPRLRQRPDGKPVLVHRQTTARDRARG